MRNLQALLVALSLLAVPGVATAEDAAASGLTVQREWKLLAIGLEVAPDLDVHELLTSTQAAIRRELPGLLVSFDLPRYRSYPGPKTKLGDPGIVRFGMRAAEADGIAIADYDVVFVFSPLYRERYFGFSHVGLEAADGRKARGGAIQTEPSRILYEGMVDALEGKHPPGFKPEEPGPLTRRFSGAFLRIVKGSRGGLEKLLGLPMIRESVLAPTIAHELGHFLAPGDPDIRDGYQKPWLKHATGPEDNPEGHGVECCMYKGRSLEFYVRKALSMRGRVVVFCDACRKKLGCPPTEPAPARPAPPEPPPAKPPTGTPPRLF